MSDQEDNKPSEGTSSPSSEGASSPTPSTARHPGAPRSQSDERLQQIKESERKTSEQLVRSAEQRDREKAGKQKEIERKEEEYKRDLEVQSIEAKNKEEKEKEEKEKEEQEEKNKAAPVPQNEEEEYGAEAKELNPEAFSIGANQNQGPAPTPADPKLKPATDDSELVTFNKEHIPGNGHLYYYDKTENHAYMINKDTHYGSRKHDAYFLANKILEGGDGASPVTIYGNHSKMVFTMAALVESYGLKAQFQDPDMKRKYQHANADGKLRKAAEAYKNEILAEGAACKEKVKNGGTATPEELEKIKVADQIQAIQDKVEKAKTGLSISAGAPAPAAQQAAPPAQQAEKQEQKPEFTPEEAKQRLEKREVELKSRQEDMRVAEFSSVPRDSDSQKLKENDLKAQAEDIAKLEKEMSELRAIVAQAESPAPTMTADKPVAAAESNSPSEQKSAVENTTVTQVSKTEAKQSSETHLSHEANTTLVHGKEQTTTNEAAPPVTSAPVVTSTTPPPSVATPTSAPTVTSATPVATAAKTPPPKPPKPAGLTTPPSRPTTPLSTAQAAARKKAEGQKQTQNQQKQMKKQQDKKPKSLPQKLKESKNQIKTQVKGAAQQVKAAWTKSISSLNLKSQKVLSLLHLEKNKNPSDRKPGGGPSKPR